MMKNILVIALIILFIVQWIVPGKIIWAKEDILKNGKEFRFRSEPIDPSNPFTGKYIWLNFKETQFDLPTKQEFQYGQDIFVVLKKDDSGYAKIENVLIDEPREDVDYVKAKLRTFSPFIGKRKGDRDSIQYQNIQIDYPFDRFYMDEYKAPKAESMYWAYGRDSSQRVYAIVRVLKGKAVIKDVMINDTSIRRLVEEYKK
jgi:uncharacterized membrane-anchored protein